MDFNQLKSMLEETQRKFPPHYPNKMHGVADEVVIIIDLLKNLVDYIGFSNTNIAIKNIVGKMINQFLISTRYEIDENNCVFETINQELENGKKITISFKEKKLELEHLNDGTITMTNNSHYPYSLSGEDYSNSIISYDVNKPNNLFLHQRFRNKSVCQSIIKFSDEGIEVNKDFKIIPITRTFKPTNQFITGSITRNGDFYTAIVKLNAVGDEFGTLVSSEDIASINSISEIVVPIRYMGALKNDLNLLCVVIEEDRDNSMTGGIKNVIDNYIYSEEENSSFDEHYEKSKMIVENSGFLEFAYDSSYITTPIIHAPYSFEILKNIKEYVNKKEQTPIL